MLTLRLRTAKTPKTQRKENKNLVSCMNELGVLYRFFEPLVLIVFIKNRVIKFLTQCEFYFFTPTFRHSTAT